MNFKNVYKNAVNSVQPNRELIDAIFQQAERENARKNSKKIWYPVISVAAAAAVVFTITFGFNGDDTHNQYTHHGTQIASVTPQKDNITEEAVSTNEPVNKVQDRAAAIPSVDNTIKQSAEIETKTAEKIQQNTYDKIAETSDMSNDLPVNDETVFNGRSSGGSGGASGGGSSAMMAKIHYEEAEEATTEAEQEFNESEFYTEDMYYRLIGMNVVDSVVLPDDMAFDSFHGVEVTRNQSGEVVYDTAMFFASDEAGEKILSMETTTLKNHIAQAIENASQKVDFSDGRYVHIKGEATETIYIHRPGMYCKLSITGFTQEQIDTVINSF